MQAALSVEISFCVVNTEQRGLLRYCLDAIARERATVDFQTEVLVLDNASQDGSADVARQHPVSTEVIALEERRGKGVNDSDLLQRARGRFCLLLNEDSELLPGATAGEASFAATGPATQETAMASARMRRAITPPIPRPCRPPCARSARRRSGGARACRPRSYRRRRARSR